MIDCFKLSFSESVGVVEVFLWRPDCPVSFVIGVQIFLHYMPAKGRLVNSKFTHLLHLLVSDLEHYFFRSGDQGSTSLRKDRRYNIYGNVERHTFEQWDARVMNTSRLGLAAWMAWPSKPNEKNIKTIYNFFKKSMTSFQPNVNELGGQHGLAIYGHLGVFPSWFRDYAAVNPLSRPMQFLSSGKQRYPAMEATSVLSAVRSHLTSVFKTQFTVAHIENIICKAYRLRKSVSDEEMDEDDEESQEDASDVPGVNLLSRETFCDLYLPGQHLFRQDKNGKMSMYSCRERAWLPLVGEYICNVWKKKGSDKKEPMQQILADLLPGDKSLLESKLLNVRNVQQINAIIIPDLYAVVPSGIIPKVYITNEIDGFVASRYGRNGLPMLGKKEFN
jgi:hypothetical protein